MRGGSGLLERDSALRLISLVLDDAQAGTGRALLIEGHAGMGKSRLHEAALDEARRRGMRVVRAAGAELERHMAFGVAVQLLKAQLDELSGPIRDELVGAAPERVRALLGATAHLSGAPGSDLALSHGLFTILATAEESRPALIAIDDLHWSDPASLEFVLYMLQRLGELPAAIVMTRRPGTDASDVIDRIGAHPRVWIETLGALGEDAVHELAHQALGDRADAAVIEACHEATAGNPFYLHELLLTLSGELSLSSEQLAEHALALAPDAVTRIVRVRVGRLGHDAAKVARATAVLGEDVPLRHAALLSGLSLDDASAAADALGGEEILLAREPLRFVHPLVRHAISNDIPAHERAGRHLDAAGLLRAEGADCELVAAHLLRGRGQGTRWVVGVLRTAADDAMRRGAPQSAILLPQPRARGAAPARPATRAARRARHGRGQSRAAIRGRAPARGARGDLEPDPQRAAEPRARTRVRGPGPARRGRGGLRRRRPGTRRAGAHRRRARDPRPAPGGLHLKLGDGHLTAGPRARAHRRS